MLLFESIRPDNSGLFYAMKFIIFKKSSSKLQLKNINLSIQFILTNKNLLML